MSIQAIKGFRDILPDEAGRWQLIEKTARQTFEGFGYREILLPYLEFTDLFSRGIGETTDIVEKEMYSLPDSKGRLMSLRPEGTASVVRAYIQDSMQVKNPLTRLYYAGPMFRRERPQKGRFRQFYQMGVEALGSADPFIEVEQLSCITLFFERLKLTNVLKLEVNSVGDDQCRPAYRELLVNYLSSREAELCEDCRRRITANPMRVLDCKNESCKAAIENAPLISDHLCEACKNHFEAVCAGLTAAGVPFVRNPRIVRGLDYYTRTAFEVTTDRLGSQNAVAGGGRYNGLVRLLDGPDTPAMGFAIGVDRVAALMEEPGLAPSPQPLAYIAILGEKSLGPAAVMQKELVSAGFSIALGEPTRGLRNHLKRADGLKAAVCVILGENEIARGMAMLRDMKTGEQKELATQGLKEELERIFKGSSLKQGA